MNLTETWVTLGRRLAVIAAASTALVCLLAHNTLLTASIRGALALVGTLLVVRVGRQALTWFPTHPAPKSHPAGAARVASPPRRVGS